MSISERLQMVIKMNGMNNTSFAEKIGVQRSSISHVLAGRNKPSIDFIQKILDNFPKVNADWLITGKKIGATNETATEKEESIPQKLHLQTVEEEEQAAYNTKKTNPETEQKKSNKKPQHKRIERIIVFYTDGTFEETSPKE